MRRGLFNAGGRLLSCAVRTLDDQDNDAIDNHLKELEKGNNELVRTINRQVIINQSVNRTLFELKRVIKNDREILLATMRDVGSVKKELIEETRAILKLFTITSLKQQVYMIQQNVIAASTGSFHPGIVSIEEIEENGINFEKLKHIKIGATTYKQKSIILALKIPSESQTANKIIRPS